MRKAYIWGSLVIGLLLFFFISGHVSWNDVRLLINRASPEYLFIYLGASIAIRLLLSWRWHTVLQAKGINVSYWKNLSYRTAGFAVSFVTPGPRVGGEFMTAGLLMRHNKKIKYSKALSTLAIDRAVEVQTFAALFFAGVFVLAALGDIPSGLRVLLLGVSSILLLLIVMLALNVTHGKPFVINLLSNLSKNPKWKREIKHFEKTLVTFYKEDKKEFILSHAISSIAWLVSIMEYKYLLLMLGFDVPLYGIFIVYSFVGLAYIMPVPLAIGTLEGGQAAAFNLINLSTTGGFILAFVTRMRDVFFTLIGFMILFYYGIAPATAAKTVRN